MRLPFATVILATTIFFGCNKASESDKTVEQIPKTSNGAPETTMELALEATSPMEPVYHNPGECPKLKGAYKAQKAVSEIVSFRTVNEILENYSLGTESSWDRVDGQVYLLERSGEVNQEKFWRSTGCSRGVIHWRRGYLIESRLATWNGSIEVLEDGSYLESSVQVDPGSNGILPSILGPFATRYVPVK